MQASLAPGPFTDAELADHMPVFLRHVISALRQRGLETSPEEASADGRAHGAQRFRLGFRLEAAVREYGELLHALLDLVEEAGVAIAIRDLRSLNDLFSNAVAEAAAEFSRRLAKAEASLLVLFEQTPVAITVLEGPSHVIALANPFTCRIWGRTRAEVLHKPLFEALPETAGQGLEELLRGVLSTGAPYVGKEMLVRLARVEDGALEDVYFDFVYQPMRVPDGGVESILVIANDVTESVRARRTAEAAVRAGEAERKKLHDLFMLAPVGICILDGPQHVYTFVNPGYSAMVNGRDVLGKPLLEALPEVRGQGFDVLLDRVMSTGEPFHGNELVARLAHHPAGEALIVNVVYVPKRDAEGTVDGVMAFAIDVTALVSARRAAEAASAELQRRHEFEQHLAGIVGHDLRNPLHAILMSSTLLLQMEELDERATRIARRIRASAERSARMIRDLLDFTQARLGGGIPIVSRATDLAVIVNATLAEVEAGSPDRAIDVTITGDTTGVWDPDRLAQVVSNLTGNALAYSPAGTRVTLRLDGGDGFVEVAVHNWGPPIPPDQLGVIFEPLRRGPQQIDRNQRSLGLGLYIVDSIVRAHEGSVSVVSTAEQGTTFTVRLPAR